MGWRRRARRGPAFESPELTDFATKGDLMIAQKLEGERPSDRVNEVSADVNSMAFGGLSFTLGLLTGLFLKAVAERVYERARAHQSHRDYERTVEYAENLPDSLGRREPPAEAGQPRYGGTGALGVSPESVLAPRSDDVTPH
jgi:hypothetical protein